MKRLTALICCVMTTSVAAAQEAKPDKTRVAIDKGLAWLAKEQQKDGSWSSNNFPSATTAFAGMALLADGNTLDEGKYKANLRRAMEWFLKFEAKDKKYNGLLADPNAVGSTGRYMSEHGVALSRQVRGERRRPDQRSHLRDRAEGGGRDPGDPQPLAERAGVRRELPGDLPRHGARLLAGAAARDAGIAVPKEAIRKTSRYLELCTDERGGIVYSGDGKKQATAGGRPTITAMALAAWLPKLDRYDNTTRKWLAFCAETPNLAVKKPVKDERFGTDLLAHYYFNKVVYHLNEKEWEAAFPDKKLPDQVNRAKYKATLFDRLRKEQAEDGSWPMVWTPGVEFNTALALNILLYEPVRLQR